MEIMKDLDTLCEIVSEKLSDKIRKVKNGGMSDGDLDTLEKLTHTLASTKKSMAFIEDEDGYSGNYPMGDGSYRNSYRGSYNHGGSYRRRDSMGRYSGERGYSRNDLADKMRDLMMEAPDERTRQEMQRMAEKLENA